MPRPAATAAHVALRTADNILARARNAIAAADRVLAARSAGAVVPPIGDGGGRVLARSVRRSRTAWPSSTAHDAGIPGMITPEEASYYEYIGAYYSGRGATVEIGPWLGRSTSHIVSGLRSSSAWDGERRLVVFDDFVWRGAWMTRYLPPHLRPPSDGESFRHLFDDYTAPFADELDVRARRVSAMGDNDHVSQLTWNDGPIEIAFIDTGRTTDVNDTWWRLLEPAFIPDRTLVIMQDWGTHRTIPVVWFNQMKDFTDSKGTQLELLHELRRGAIATFIYR